MAAQVDKEVEIKITRDLSDEGGSENEIRKILNRRLGDVRRDLRGEYAPRLEAIERILDERHIADRDRIAAKAMEVIADYRTAKDGFDESNNKVGVMEQRIQTLQRAIQDIQSGVGNQAMVKAQIRNIAQQLLDMSDHDLPMLHVPTFRSPYVGGDTSPYAGDDTSPNVDGSAF